MAIVNTKIKRKCDPEKIFTLVRHLAVCKDQNHTRETQVALDLIAEYEDELIGFVEPNHLSIELYRCLKIVDALSLISKDNLLKLEARVWEGEQRQGAAIIQIKEIAKSFNKYGVDFIFLKTAALLASERIQIPCQRYHVDIDVQVRKQHLDLANVALESIGYKSEKILPESLADYWYSKHLPSYHAYDRIYRIEVHQRSCDNTLFNPAPIDEQTMFSNTRKITFQGIEMRIPTDEFYLFISYYHSQIFDGYRFCGLKNYRSFLDVALTSTSKEAIEQHKTFITKAFLHYNGRKNVVGGFPYFLDQALSTMGVRPSPLTKSGKYNIEVYKNNEYFISSEYKSASAFLKKILHFLSQHINEMIRYGSKAGRIERDFLYEKNPTNWKYLPILKQIFMKEALTHRIQYFMSKFR